MGHIAATGSPGVVIAQTPPPKAEGVDRPRVSVLLSEPAEDSAGSGDGYVMPSLVGLTISGAYARAGAAGLRIVSAEDVTPATAAGTTNVPVAGVAGTGTGSAPAPESGAVVPAVTALAPGIVAAQSPLAGHRVSRGDTVRLSLMH